MLLKVWVVLVVDIAWSYGQNTTVWPEERGLILGVYHDNSDPKAAQLRHIQAMPGYENFNGTIPGLRFENSKIQFLSTDVDFREKIAYFYDYHLRSIILGTGYNAALNNSGMSFYFMHIGVSRGTVQLAVDWLSHTVYWSDSVFRWIMAAPGQISKLDSDYYKKIVTDHLEAPDGLAVDPTRALLFWSDNGENPKIERANLDGSNRHTIVTQHLEGPLAMEVDIPGQRIYWLDSYTESLLSAQYDGSDIRLVNRIPKATLLDLASFRDVIYVADIKNGDVVTLNKTTGEMESTALNIKPETIYSVAVYAEEKQPMLKDTCATLNCEQLCITTPGGAKCECSDGYTFNTTTKNCTATYLNAHMGLLYANTTMICTVDIRSLAYFGHEPMCVYSVNGTYNSTTNVTTAPADPSLRNTSIKMFDLDMEDRIMYIVLDNNVIISRELDLAIDNPDVDILTTATGNVSGLAYDAEDDNLYWSEREGNIQVINVADRAVEKVNPSTLQNPRNLIVLLAERKLAWIGGTNSSNTIQTMNIDGTGLQNVASNIPQIVSLVYDREQKVFYFMQPSSKQIYRVSLDGPATPELMKVTLDVNAFILLQYNNYFLWVYIPTTYPYKYLVKTNQFSLNKEIGHGYFDNISVPVDMKILDVDLQRKDKIHPCAKSVNFECDQICISKYINGSMTAVCECTVGFVLASDKKTCKTSNVEDDFIIVSDWTHDKLQQIDLNTNNIYAFSNEDDAVYMGVHYHPTLKKLLWTEYSDRRIYSANLNGTNKAIYADIGSFGYPYRMDLDQTTGNLYYTAYYSYRSHVGFVTKSGAVFQFTADYASREYGAIAVHPAKGSLYYTVYGPPSFIMRCNMDGTNCSQVISGSYIGYPDGLTIDYNNGYLYWSDASEDAIQRCDLDGKSCVTLFNNSWHNSEQVRDLEFDGTYLYYSAYKNDHVKKMAVTPPYSSQIVGQNPGLGKLDSMTFYSSKNTNKQPVSDACKARNGLGDCSSVCVPTPRGRTCMCEEGVKLNPDGRTCANVYQCPDLIFQKNDTSVRITLPSTCTRYIGDTCSYICPDGFIPVGSGQLKCLNVGWDNQTLALCEEFACPSTIPNGQLNSPCSRMPGVVCDFTCNTGYVKTEDSTFCTKNGTYHKNVADFCAPMKCDATIPHGSLDTQCTRNIGAQCTFSCNKFYTTSTRSITCQQSGWNVDPTTLCQVKKCADSSLQNGVVSASCSKEIGQMCAFTCAIGYVNATSAVVCRDDDIWHPPKACIESSASNPSISVSAAQTADSEGLSKGGTIAGIVVLVLVVVGLAAVIVFLIRRGMIKTPALTASFHNQNKDRQVAIENPGYLHTNEEMQPGTSGIGTIRQASATPGLGMENPIYMDESMRPVSEISTTDDNAVLTKDSWQKVKEQKDKEYVRFP